MIKKGATLVSVLALLFTMLTFAAFSASAATVVSVKHDFAGYTDGDTGALSLVKIFKGLESADHARIKYAFGKGYLCPDGGGVTCSLVYKLETGGKSLFTSFYGYHCELFGAVSGHYNLTRMLQCEDVDILAGPVGYSEREATGGIASYMTIVSSVAEAGKMWFDESDYRTYLSKDEEMN